MIIGVIGFYFVISNINSITSNSINQQRLISLQKSFLYKIHEEKKLKPQIFKIINKQIENAHDFKKRRTVTEFLNIFPKVLKRELKYTFYKNYLFGNFQFLKNFEKKIINSIGDHMIQVNFTKCNSNLRSNNIHRKYAFKFNLFY